MSEVVDDDRERVLGFIRRKMDLFNAFRNVYLFGSVLSSEGLYNDVDILAVYDRWNGMIGEAVERAVNELEVGLQLPVDITVLSENEVREVAFLERIRPTCLRLK